MPDDPFLEAVADLTDAAFVQFRSHPSTTSKRVWAILLGLFADMCCVWREAEERGRGRHHG